MRFWQELLHPELKCERVGHRTEQLTSLWTVSCPKCDELLGEKNSYHFCCVAHQMRRTRTVCNRCRKVLETKWKEIDSLQSLTLSSDLSDEFENKGMIRE